VLEVLQDRILLLQQNIVVSSNLKKCSNLVVGDKVMTNEKGNICSVLPRKNLLSRTKIDGTRIDCVGTTRGIAVILI